MSRCNPDERKAESGESTAQERGKGTEEGVGFVWVFGVVVGNRVG